VGIITGIRIGVLEKKNKMKYLIFTLLLGVFTVLRAQGTPLVEVVSGVKYYVHFVQSGNTLYGIHKTYNVSLDQIITANPGCEKGLVEGQKLLIPVSLVEVKHTVAAKETLFAISKKYGVKQEAILADNPGAELGLKVGQVLLIKGVMKDIVFEDVNNFTEEPVPDLDTIRFQSNPNLQMSFSDSIIDHIVLAHENLYIISKRYMVSTAELQRFNGLKNTKIKPGDRLMIPVKKEKVEPVLIRPVTQRQVQVVEENIVYPPKSKYNVALLLPLFLDRTAGYPEQLATFATEFYMGAKLALDSLESLGLKANVYVFDVKSDSTSVKSILGKDEFLDMDMIIGPFSMESATVVARWCKTNEVRMICPISLPTALLQDNRFVVQSVPSEATQQSELALFALKNKETEQYILIKPNGDKDQVGYASFRNTFTTAPYIGSRPKLVDATLENFTTFLRKGVQTVIIFPASDKLQALKFMNSLNASKSDAQFIDVYGSREWLNFDEMKASFRNRFHFHFASPNDLNFTYEKTERFLRKYRTIYNADLSKMAAQGFDVTYYFIANQLMGMEATEGVMNAFNLVQKGTGNGAENGAVFIIRQEDYKLIRSN
jgi:LysM repeat protein